MTNREELFQKIDSFQNEMTEFLKRIIAIPAIGPMSGGTGEQAKADMIEKLLGNMGFDLIHHHDALDERVQLGKRPNISVHLKGISSERRIILITHMDVVPPGDLNAWYSDPFELLIEGNKLIGRGVEDNGQALTASIFAAKSLIDLGILPVYDTVIFMVSDEEESNEKGIGHLLEEGLLKEGDLILVPDHGDPEGRVIEVCEKTQLWVKVTVKGEQCHASMPHLGRNAFRASMEFGSRVDKALHEKFSRKDTSFDHPYSSFEPTKKEPGVSGVNVLPGEDSFYFDCRLLPGHSREEVLDEMKRVAEEVGSELDVNITFEVVLSETTLHPTPPDAQIVKMLSRAVQIANGSIPVTGGIGGGTCAALLRNAGFEVAVWETIHNRAHSPNEYILMDNLMNDCKVYAALFTGIS
jgi:succinyl-diaminopimelate desuccinylase